MHVGIDDVGHQPFRQVDKHVAGHFGRMFIDPSAGLGELLNKIGMRLLVSSLVLLVVMDAPSALLRT
jgi:hypothetical protein